MVFEGTTDVNTADRLQIHELLALHGHLADEGRFDRLDELFTADAVYDMSGAPHRLAARSYRPGIEQRRSGLPLLPKEF